MNGEPLARVGGRKFLVVVGSSLLVTGITVIGIWRPGAEGVVQAGCAALAGIAIAFCGGNAVATLAHTRAAHRAPAKREADGEVD